MAELRGLDGVKGPLPVQHVASVEQAIKRIQKRRAITAAGNDGALNVWRDDRRVLRSHFMRYLITLDQVEHRDIESLRRWLTEWWPKLGREDAPADDRKDE